MSSSRQVTDLGEHYARKGAEHERLRIIEWLHEVHLQLAAEATVESTGDPDIEEKFQEAEKRGALAVIAVLIEKIEESGA